MWGEIFEFVARSTEKSRPHNAFVVNLQLHKSSRHSSTNYEDEKANMCDEFNSLNKESGRVE